jgi:hypothetical protein
MHSGIPVQTEGAGVEGTVAERKQVGSLRKAASVIATAIVLSGVMATAHAEKIVFDFNVKCFFQFSCAAVEKIGTLTLSNSTVDANRVDFTLAISPPIVRLDRLYLNYGGPEVNAGARYVSIVEVNAAPGVLGDETGNYVSVDRIGAAAWFDISVDLHRSPVQFAGSLVLSEPTAFTRHQAVNLNAAMFNVQDPDSWIYAELIGGTAETTVWYGATVSHVVSEPDLLAIGNINVPPPPDTVVNEPSGAVVQAALPEPGTLGLLGVAAAFLGSAIGLKKRSRA